jgi:hypothetical protein
MVGAALSVPLIGLAVLIAGAPVAWFLLGICAVLVVAVLVPAVREGRFFEPLPLIAAFSAAAFVVRPFQLFLNSTDLLSWYPSGSTLNMLLRLDHQEIAAFATTKLHGPLQPALTRTIGACALFLALFICGYYVPIRERFARRLATVGQSVAGLNVRVAVAASLAIGLAGQVAIIVKTGGITKAANNQITQRALNAGGLGWWILASFAIVAVIVWVAWRRPTTRLEWAGLAVVTLEVSAFSVLVGSRTRLLALALALVIVVHYLWRPLRFRQLVAALLVGVVVAGALLGIRQATATKPFGEALASAPKYVVDPRGILNDVTEFDQLFVATSAIGPSLPYKHGAWFVEAFHSFVPRFIDSKKPQSSDVVFRKAVWGNQVLAGRPPTVVGDFYYDFGFFGIAVGSILLGLLARALLGLVSRNEGGGREYRVALYAIGIFVLYELITSTYSVALGYVLTLVVPFLVTVHVLGRVGGRTRIAGKRTAETDPVEART